MYKETNHTDISLNHAGVLLLKLELVNRSELCAFINEKGEGDPTTSTTTTTAAPDLAPSPANVADPSSLAPAVLPPAGNGTGTPEEPGTPSVITASPGANGTAVDPAPEPESGVNPLYWSIPLAVVLLVIMGLIGILIHRYTKRAGFQCSGKARGGEPTKSDGSNV
jgi:hypothetical protein